MRDRLSDLRPPKRGGELCLGRNMIMRLEMPVELAAAYKSPSQRARIISEAWGSSNLYCPRCDSPRVEASTANTQAVDFVCPRCTAAFQLKSQAHEFSRRVTDAAYEVMRRAIEESRTPHLLTLHYDSASWSVRNLTLIPSFALTLSCLEKRKPLAPTARRKGWVGCNILLFNIPRDARIAMISDGRPASPGSSEASTTVCSHLRGLNSKAAAGLLTC